MTHLRHPNPATTTQTDASDAIRRAALKAWLNPEADPQEAWKQMQEIKFVQTPLGDLEQPEQPEPEPRKHWWSNDYD